MFITCILFLLYTESGVLLTAAAAAELVYSMEKMENC